MHRINDNMLKGPSQTTDSRNSIELANTVAVSEKHGTQSDERDMDRMGKLQELRVCSTDCAEEESSYSQETSGNSSS
jgi:hypothetical protein